MSDRIKRARWALARRLYHSPLRPLWSWVAPRWTAEEVTAIKERAHQRYEQMRRHFS